jgi:hypothetical protein
MTLATQDSRQDLKQDPTRVPAPRSKQRAIPVLETARLRLRAPRHGDIKALVRLAGERGVAENTARIPHPYTAVTRRNSSPRPIGKTAKRPS